MLLRKKYCNRKHHLLLIVLRVSNQENAKQWKRALEISRLVTSHNRFRFHNSEKLPKTCWWTVLTMSVREDHHWCMNKVHIQNGGTKFHFRIGNYFFIFHSWAFPTTWGHTAPSVYLWNTSVCSAWCCIFGICLELLTGVPYTPYKNHFVPSTFQLY